MSIRKILLLASAVLALAALSTPGLAQADPRWREAIEGPPIKEGEHRELHLEGEIGIDFLGTATMPKCAITFGGLAVNENKMAEGLITNLASGACPTILPNCTFEPTIGAQNWPVTGTTKITGSQTGLEIKEMTIVLDFSPGCAAFGLPAQESIAGTATPTSCVPECLNFEEHKDDLKLEKIGTSVNLTGFLTMTPPLVLE